MKKIYRFFLRLFLLLVFCELILRIFFYQPLKIRQQPAVYTGDTRFGFLPVPRAHGIKSIPNIHQTFTLNNQGFIGPDFQPTKKNGIYRIIIVGYSNLEGFYVSEKENAISLLQSKLITSGYRAEVINCSIGGGGYRKIQQYRFLKEWISKYQADMILFETGLPFYDQFISKEAYRGYLINYWTGSAGSKEDAERIVDNIWSSSAPRFLYRAFYSLRVLSKIYLRVIERGKRKSTFAKCLNAFIENEVKLDIDPAKGTRSSITESVQLLQDLVDDYKKRNTKIVMFQLPNKGSIQRTINFYNVSQAYNLPVIKAFTDESKNASFFFDDDHLNANGHKILADSLYASLISTHLLTKGQ